MRAASDLATLRFVVVVLALAVIVLLGLCIGLLCWLRAATRPICRCRGDVTVRGAPRALFEFDCAPGDVPRLPDDWPGKGRSHPSETAYRPGVWPSPPWPRAVRS